MKLLSEIKDCRVCESFLDQGCNPVVSLSKKSKILIIGQAPGIKVHHSSVPWQDKSGDNLRNWLGIDADTFYNPDIIGIMPMGFCYPGKGKSGDLPPRKECAPLWHDRLLSALKEVKLTLLIGQYAQGYYLANQMQKNLTETVKNYKSYLPQYLPLPHPSPRNNIWQKKNPWFKEELLPQLKDVISNVM